MKLLGKEMVVHCHSHHEIMEGQDSAISAKARRPSP
jgi:hypothetical protein